jgi:flagellar hook assembly protein FlgD
MIAYPGNQQIPIQVDVTNVHSVRSSSTLVGAKTKVSAAPYLISYRLSKDALTSILVRDEYDTSSTDTPKVLKTIIEDQPRLGEGTPGGPGERDIVTTEVEAWDGRDDNGRLLPLGNYVVSIQAKSNDEWTGVGVAFDLSRAVTRQLSLDPLRITDMTVTGLAKTSTAYAMLSYMITEAATVHVRIYPPGTTFVSSSGAHSGDDFLTIAFNPDYRNGDISTNLRATATPLAVFDEQKAHRVSVNTKWDGRCWYEAGCTPYGYNVGAALPDGDYVYAIWAEIPYLKVDGTYINDVDRPTINGRTWNGVKTRAIETGFLPINRGTPEILIQPVGYSSVGSSPTAFGLDPFIMRFSLSRDSIVSARILTTQGGRPASGQAITDSGPFLVRTLINNQAKVANQMNVETWDGKDDNGRYVTQGTYMLEVAAKDSIFPEKVVISTVEFPVDLFRVVDVVTTPIIGDATSQAQISYVLSKGMDVDLEIYDKDIIIPTPARADQWPPEVCPPNATSDTCIHRMGSDQVNIAPIKTYSGARLGEGVTVTEFWDGLLYDEGNTASQEVKTDGFYPYIIKAKASVPTARYYTVDSNGTPVPHNALTDSEYHIDPNNDEFVINDTYASDKVTGHITVSRGLVYFTHILINPSRPTLFYSSETVMIPPYEMQFMTTRTAKVTIEIRSNDEDMCIDPALPPGTEAPAGTVCRTLTRTRPNAPDNSTIYDGMVLNKVYWDGKDETGEYVKTGGYEVRFKAEPYPNNIAESEESATIKSEILNVNNFQLFDRYIWDVSNQSEGAGKFAYQVSVPMKVAIQIFKPGTKIADINSGTLIDPANPTTPYVDETNIERVLVKSIVVASPHLVAIEELWDGTDYAGQRVPDGFYPFRYVTVTDSYDMDSITGAVRTQSGSSIQDLVADWDKFINLGVINVSNGDSFFADLDWKDNKVTMFFPNPLRQSKGQFEITKVPAPGLVSIKIYNIAGDLIRDGGYQCINARGVSASLEQINSQGGLQPDWNMVSSVVQTGTIVGGRNFALRCEWDKTNSHGKQVARGLYYAIMELNPTRGNAKISQKVIKILIP